MTMVSILSEYLGGEGGHDKISILDVGASSGVICEYLSRYFGHVTGMDVDEKAIAYAQSHFKKDNLTFEVGDAMAMQYPDDVFDVVICSQVYEHVPNAETLMAEIFRVLKPCGVVYFSAGNRLMPNEPHYDLPLLSVMPRPLAHLYFRLSGRGSHYDEKFYSYWGLKKLIRQFVKIDYTEAVLRDPEKYKVAYMVKPGGKKQRLALFITTYLMWLMPGYLWLLKKPAQAEADDNR